MPKEESVKHIQTRLSLSAEHKMSSEEIKNISSDVMEHFVRT